MEQLSRDYLLELYRYLTIGEKSKLFKSCHHCSQFTVKELVMQFRPQYYVERGLIICLSYFDIDNFTNIYELFQLSGKKGDFKMSSWLFEHSKKIQNPINLEATIDVLVTNGSEKEISTALKINTTFNEMDTHKLVYFNFRKAVCLRNKNYTIAIMKNLKKEIIKQGLDAYAVYLCYISYYFNIDPIVLVGQFRVIRQISLFFSIILCLFQGNEMTNFHFYKPLKHKYPKFKYGKFIFKNIYLKTFLLLLCYLFLVYVRKLICL